jgi:hypothetical protein
MILGRNKDGTETITSKGQICVCPTCGHNNFFENSKLTIEANKHYFNCGIIINCQICNWTNFTDELLLIGEYKNTKRTDMIDNMLKKIKN